MYFVADIPYLFLDPPAVRATREEFLHGSRDFSRRSAHRQVRHASGGMVSGMGLVCPQMCAEWTYWHNRVLFCLVRRVLRHVELGRDHLHYGGGFPPVPWRGASTCMLANQRMRRHSTHAMHRQGAAGRHRKAEFDFPEKHWVHDAIVPNASAVRVACLRFGSAPLTQRALSRARLLQLFPPLCLVFNPLM